MKKLTQEQTLGIVRHVVTAIGAILIYKGKVDASTWTIVTGSVVGIAAVLWSVTSKQS